MPTENPTIDSAHAAALAVTSAVQSGQAMRASASELDWGAICGFSIMANLTQASTSSRYYTLLGATKANDAEIVPEAQQKPEVAVTEREDLPLVKHAGFATASVEDLTVATAEWLISGVILRQIARSVDVAVIDALAAKNTQVPGSNDALGGILASQAQLLSNGTCPTHVVCSPAGYVELVSGMAASQVSLLGDATASGGSATLFGMQVIASAACPDDKFYLFDQAGVVHVSLDSSPMIFVGAMNTQNLVDIIGDHFCAIGVASPDAVAELTVTAPAP
jgi:hypothetical protein